MAGSRIARLDRPYFVSASLLDLVITAGSIVLAVLLRFGRVEIHHLGPMAGTWVFYSVAVLTGSSVESLYVVRTGANKTMHFYRIARLALVTTVLYIVFVYAIKFPPRLFISSRMVILLLFVIWLWAYLFLRILLLPGLVTFLMRHILHRGRIGLLLCGDEKVLSKLAGVLGRSPVYRAMLEIVGSCDACHLPCCDRTEYYLSKAEETGASQICIVDAEADYGTVARTVMQCEESGFPLVMYSPHFLDLRYYDPWLSFSDIGAMPFFYGGWTRLAEAYWRLVDIVVSGLSILLLSPLLLVTALAVKLTSRGPVLFRQTRVCKDMEKLLFPKFRSMYRGRGSAARAHREYFREYVEGRAAGTNGEGEGLYKLDQSRRITPVGRVIRRTSIDELPQTFCVLKGNMSLVGPRPCIPYELEHYKTWHRVRFRVKPGLTGIWQVYGRSRLPFDAAQFLDFCYVYHRSYALNTRLILKTFPVVLFGRGGV